MRKNFADLLITLVGKKFYYTIYKMSAPEELRKSIKLYEKTGDVNSSLNIGVYDNQNVIQTVKPLTIRDQSGNVVVQIKDGYLAVF